MTHPLKDTLGDRQWLMRRENLIRNLFPENFTEICGPHADVIYDRMNKMGIPRGWGESPTQEFAKIMLYFVRLGLVEKEGNKFRSRLLTP